MLTPAAPLMTRSTSPPTHSALAALVTIAFALVASAPARADLCLPDRPPTPGCQLAPPGRAPVVPPQEEAAYRAKVLADYNASNGPERYRRALEAKNEERRRAFIDAAEAARPADVPVRFPTIEALSGFRLGLDLARKSYTQAGPEVGLAYRLDGTFAIELPVALLRTWGDLGEWGTFGTAPALVVGASFKTGMIYARGGPDILVPTGASGVAPNAMVGANLGFGLLFFIAPIGDGGFTSLGYDLRFVCRGGIGGPSSVLDAPRCGVDAVLGLRLAY